MSANAASSTRDHDSVAPTTRDGASKLVCRTFLDDTPNTPPVTGVVVYDYGGGLVEAVAYRHLERRDRSDGTSLCREEDDRRRQDNEQRAMARSRSKVRRLVMAGGLTHLLTLTTRASIPDTARFWPLWTRFVRLVRENLGDWQYVVVPELQKRGAVHVHAAVKGFQNVRLLRRLWLRVLTENNIQGGGSVNVRAPNGGQRPKVARYLSKYIGKAFGGAIRTFGKHRYRVSEGVSAAPTSRRLSAWPNLRAVLEAVLMEAGLAVGGAVELDDVGAVWGCSWDREGDPVMTTG